MDQYLLQILKETNTIIIPDLGALTITNATTGEVMFMPFLKHDDGKLSAHIAQKEGIEENEAKNIIAKHVREIKSKLDQGESYDMFQFGTFSKGSDGDIEFENWSGDKTEKAPAEQPKTEEPKQEEPILAKPADKAEKAKEEKPKAAAKEEPVKKPVEKPAKKAEEKTKAEPKAEKAPKVEKPKDPVKEVKSDKPKAAAPVPPKKEEPVVEKKEIPVVPVTPPAPKKEMNIAEKEELSKTVEKLEQLKKDKEEGNKKKKRSPGFYMLMVIIVVLVAGGTYFAIDYDNLKQHVPFLADAKKESKEPKAIDEMKETIGVDEVNAEMNESEDNEADSEVDAESDIVDNEPVETEPEPIVEPEPVKNDPEPMKVSGSNDQPFHIVAGVFSDPGNATRLVEKLQGMGYPAKVIERGPQSVVSVQSYGTKAEAEAAISSVQDAAPKGWVLEWR